MATTVSTADGKTTITIKYAATTALMAEVLESIGRALFDQRGAWLTETPPETYAELTQAQKLRLIDAYVRYSLIELHRHRLVRVVEEEHQAAVMAAHEAGSITLE